MVKVHESVFSSCGLQPKKRQLKKTGRTNQRRKNEKGKAGRTSQRRKNEKGRRNNEIAKTNTIFNGKELKTGSNLKEGTKRELIIR